MRENISSNKGSAVGEEGEEMNKMFGRMAV